MKTRYHKKCGFHWHVFIQLMLYYMVFMHHVMTKGISSKTQFGVSASIKHFHRLRKKLSRHLSSPRYFTGLAISAQSPSKHGTCGFLSCVSLSSQENAESPRKHPFLSSPQSAFLSTEGTCPRFEIRASSLQI